MSIYFFSEKDGEIKAIAGIKSLILPHGIAAKIQSQVQHSLNLKDKNINKEYRGLLRQQIDSAELREEYDHFQCLIHSKAASIFHLRNILVRIALSGLYAILPGCLRLSGGTSYFGAKTGR